MQALVLWLSDHARTLRGAGTGQHWRELAFKASETRGNLDINLAAAQKTAQTTPEAACGCSSPHGIA
jgi:hypothetical protein